ncbi:biotin transporter BioY [Cognatishimia sp. D5M38]|jgi:biotin transport system substrate-specific component|uniref:Biotin transporter n=1 Tax=Cognatishimia coralii TaxID=3083254 RepID=A0ABU8QK35_9RHOB|nr:MULTISPECIES: biotin transporter BioY [Roseobacteraceae]MCI5038168.1 biotin transporter BioY [Donghicola eburneus]
MAQSQSRHTTSLHTVAKSAMVAIPAVALIILSARIQVPMYPAPMTMQLAAVLGVAAFLPIQSAILPITLYLGLGLAGVPVFAGASAGPAYFAGPTGGYLFGFFLASALIIASRQVTDRLVLRMLAIPLAAVMVLVTGWVWLSVLIGPAEAFNAGVMPFLAGDAVKSVLIMLLIYAVHAQRLERTKS